VAVALAGPYASLHLAPDRQPLDPTTQFFTGRMPFLPPNQQRRSTEGLSMSVVNVFIGTARTVCRSGSVKRYGVRPSLRPSVYSIRSLHQHAAGLLLGARPVGDIDRLLL